MTLIQKFSHQNYLKSIRMKKFQNNAPPKDAQKRKNIDPVICYPEDNLPNNNFMNLKKVRRKLLKINEVIVPPRDAKTFEVPAGYFFRIECIEGSQVGDLNLFNSKNLDENFYSGKTRALHGTHLSNGDSLWSSFPFLRALATITYDTLDWYGWDKYGGSVHDVIGTRCDPYTAKLLNKLDYNYCCHSNLIRALVNEKGLDIKTSERLVHDVLNVFMCTGFTQDTHQYFMKASPARKGDYLEFFAQTNLLGILSSCPGGNCSSKHSSDEAQCYPLAVKIYKPTIEVKVLNQQVSNYDGYHGIS